MKHKTQKHLLVLTILFAPLFVIAQTTNTGILSISPGTQLSTMELLDNKTTGDLVNDGELFVYKHYNNDGLVTYTPGITSGITRMRGISGFQSLSGTVPMEWYHAEFNNTTPQTAFHLINQISIAGKSDFQHGIVNNDTYGGLLIFESKATAINTSNESHVNGKVLKNGNTAFIYPIGDGVFYRKATISAPNALTDAYTGKYLLKNSNTMYPHKNKTGIIKEIDTNEYWTLDKINGQSSVILTLSWDNATTPASIIAAPQTAIHIVRWDASQNLWVDEGGVVDEISKTVSTPIDISGYGIFTLARIDEDQIILPCNKLVIYNGISSSNQDGTNDYFRIDGLSECSSNNSVEIYNRWGVLVYETTNYNSNGNVFKGYSEGKSTIMPNKLLPSGTYFYVLKFNYESTSESTKTIKKTGYLYLN